MLLLSRTRKAVNFFDDCSALRIRHVVKHALDIHICHYLPGQCDRVLYESLTAAQEIVLVVLDVLDLGITQVGQTPDFHELQDQRLGPDDPQIVISYLVLTKFTEGTYELRHVAWIGVHRAMLLLVRIHSQDFTEGRQRVEFTLNKLVLWVELFLACFDEALEHSAIS